jgi:hypothetical protein
VPEYRARVDDARVSTVDDLRAELARDRDGWRAFHAVMAGGLFGDERFVSKPVYRMGRFTLSRFLPAFDPDGENHIGETITDREGRLAYLKTFRLSAAQTRRGHLLSRLAAHDWHLDDTAAALGTDRAELVHRIDRAGFGYLLRPDVIDAVRAQVRRTGSARGGRRGRPDGGRGVAQPDAAQ